MENLRFLHIRSINGGFSISQLIVGYHAGFCKSIWSFDLPKSRKLTTRLALARKHQTLEFKQHPIPWCVIILPSADREKIQYFPVKNYHKLGLSSFHFSIFFPFNCLIKWDYQIKIIFNSGTLPWKSTIHMGNHRNIWEHPVEMEV